MAERPSSHGSLRTTAEVLSIKQSGDYVTLSLVAGAAAGRARPGTFVMMAVGGETSRLLLPRALWVYRARPTGAYSGTIDVVFTVRGPGSQWLAGLRPRDRVPVLGPLGRPFSLPKQPVSCALVGHGHALAPLFLLAERLRERECEVHLVIGADSESSVYGILEARRIMATVTLASAHGAAGSRGSVADVLPGVLARHHVDVVFASGRLESLAEVASIAASAGIWTQVAVEAPMGCGTGLCSSCIIPTKDAEGRTVPALCCVDGPVFPAHQVDWATLGPQWT